MKREFTSREKALLLVLIVILLISGYSAFFLSPLQTHISDAQAQQSDALDQLQVETVKAQQLKKMKEDLAQLDKTESGSRIPDYDNLQNVMTQLDAILSAASDYDLSFPQVEAQGNLMIRPVQMTFTCANYAAAKAVMKNLSDCIYRCRLDAISVSALSGEDGQDITRVPVTVTLTANFYERAAAETAAAASSADSSGT